MKNNVRILVVVVTYNAIQWVELCIGSLYKSTIVPDVYVVDNGSSDKTQEYIRKHYPKAIFHQSDVNLGFGKANNLGLQYALDHNYEYVYLLNQDAWVMTDTFERLIDLSKYYPEYGILSPFQMNADLYHIDRNFVIDVMGWRSNPNIVSDLYNQFFSEVYSVPQVMAAHWFMTRECLLKVGGFSPSFSHYAEDDNYADRVNFKGMKIGIVPSLRVVHDRGQREDSKKKKMYLAYTQLIRKICDPKSNFGKQYIKAVYILLKNTLSCKSIVPLRDVFRITFNIRKMYHNRKLSMYSDCAFLHYGNVVGT